MPEVRDQRSEVSEKNPSLNAFGFDSMPHALNLEPCALWLSP
jgi:hypothetical protein